MHGKSPVAHLVHGSERRLGYFPAFGKFKVADFSNPAGWLRLDASHTPIIVQPKQGAADRGAVVKRIHFGGESMVGIGRGDEAWVFFKEGGSRARGAGFFPVWGTWKRKD